LAESTLTGIIHDFKKQEIYAEGRPERKPLLVQDKGQALMVRQSVDRVKEGGFPIISLEEVFSSTEACFAIVKSIKPRQSVKLVE
jgi:hypothetical protein